MESIYWRYHYSIRSCTAVISLFALCINCSYSQITEEYKGPINDFISNEFVSLLQKSKDYKSVDTHGTNLRNALSNEISTTSIPINPNTIIEYAKTKEQGEQILISDKLLPFLINYSGKTLDQPSITLECIVKVYQNFQAYYYSQNVISAETTLRVAIFRVVENGLELRRLSFANELPKECMPYIEPEVISDNTSSPSSSGTPNTLQAQNSRIPVTSRLRSTIPRITIRQAMENNGQAIIYGFIQNFTPSGFLTDMETGNLINVSSIDGFFVMKKYLSSSGYKELRLRYDYEKKFIMDKKLVFVKS